MFGKNTTRFASTSLIAFATLIPLTGADCANDTTGGLLDPTGQLTDTSGEPEFVFQDGQIFVNGVHLIGDPSFLGYDVEEQIADDNARAKDADAEGAIEKNDRTAKAVVTNTKMYVTANPVVTGTNVTFTPMVTGGTGRYWFFYKLERDTNWTRAGNTYTRKLTRTPYERMYFAAIDTNYVQSAVRAWTVTVNEAAPPPLERLCPTIAGTSWTQSNTLEKMTFSLPQGQFVGARVEGSWCGDFYTLVGTIIASPSNCPNCIVVEGTWKQRELVQGPINSNPDVPECSIPEGFPTEGEFRMTFEPDLASFSAKWSAIGETHWRPDYWTGSRSNCN